MRILLIRHSIADYEEAFKPGSLTEEGMELAKKAAEEIATMVGDLAVQIGTSPAKRAQATADYICDALAFPRECIQTEPNLADTQVHDVEGRKEFFERALQELDVHDLHELDGWYLKGEARFDAYPELFEPRTMVANRVFTWLGGHVQDFHDRAKMDFLILITHAEVINLVLAGFGYEEPVRQCEILDLNFERAKRRGCVRILATFRGETKKRTFKVPARAFGQQFGPWW